MSEDVAVGSIGGEESLSAEGNRYRTGTLQYTKISLLMLFVWLMWGDFCYTLMDTVEPSIMPFVLNKLNASNTLISLFITTIPAFLNLLLNPIISVKSDRYRSRLGRRIPFLMFATPFIALFLVLTGFSHDIGIWIHSHLFASSGRSPEVIILWLLGALIVGYRFFNLFVSTVFYYLFNDVVPEHFMGRFTTGFRAFGVIANFTYQWFIFKHAEENAKWIFIGIGLLYLVGFALMCFMVKEGDYPPPPEIEKKGSGFVSAIRMYFEECFSHKFYVVWFLVYSTFVLAGCANPFGLLMTQKALGVSLSMIGHIAAVGSVASFVFLFPAGILSDRFHPFRVFLASVTALLVVTSVMAVLLTWFTWPMKLLYPILLANTLLGAPLSAIAITAMFPLGMRLVPRDRYGQFSSAAAMTSSLILMLGGVLAGQYMDFVKGLLHGNVFYLRYINLWPPMCYLITIVTGLSLYRMWKKFGGDKSFSPPDPRKSTRGIVEAE